MWFENYLEDHLELTDEVKTKLDGSRRENLIPKLKPALDALVNNGIFIRPELIASGLRKVDE